MQMGRIRVENKRNVKLNIIIMQNYGYSRTQQRKKGQESPQEKAKKLFPEDEFHETWIESGADEYLPDYAEKMGKRLADNKLTSSKIRSIYGEIKRIQMGEFEKEKTSFYLLKPKVAYAVGRERENVGLQLFKLIFDKAFACVKDGQTFNYFSNFMEAILAYHRTYSN